MAENYGHLDERCTKYANKAAELDECNRALEAKVQKLEGLVKDAWKEGCKSALEHYAWWRDGVEYVGTCGTTLKQALDDLEEETKRGN